MKLSFNFEAYLKSNIQKFEEFFSEIAISKIAVKQKN